jgi:anaerobic selenocysteine-containing dehydrogenase
MTELNPCPEGEHTREGKVEETTVREVRRTVCAHDCPDACSVLVTVEAGRVVRTVGDPQHPFTRGFLCGKVNRYAERVHSPERVLTPLRRVGAKGAGHFTPITWDEALDEVVSRWQAIIARYGSEAIAGYAYSSHQGLVNRNFTQALFHALGATRVNAGAVCDTCCGEAWELTIGPAGGTDPERVQDADLLISWGANLDSTNVHQIPFIDMARRKGAKLVVIDVWRTRAARRADWFIPIRVGTDAALALGLAHVLHRDNLLDHDYIQRLVLGYERWAQEVLPRYTPAAVEAITGVPATDVETLARTYGQAKAPFIRLGQGLSRHASGGAATRAITCLPGLVGAWQRPGGGALLSTADSYKFNFSAVRRPDLQPGPRRLLNTVRFGRALLEWQNPPLMALFIQSNNPATTCPEQALVRRGLVREDLFTVVHDTFLSETARYADLVLPACTSFESEDLYRGYGTYYVQYGPQVLTPQGEAWPNYHLVATLARRLGLHDPVFSRTPREHMAALLDVHEGPVAGLHLDDLLDGMPRRLNVPVLGHTFDQAFPTPSGKLQIACPELATRGLPDLPDYVPAVPTAYPLRLVTAPGHHLHHSAFLGVASLRRDEGGPWVRLHPDEALPRGISQGQAVELFNDAGVVGLYARLTTDVLPGMVVVEGHRPQSQYLSGGPLNVLCSDRYADLGEGATYQDTWLDVRPLA